MATRQVLREWSRVCESDYGAVLNIESLGGVDATRRVQFGESFDLVFLAHDSLKKLEASGHVKEGSTVPLMRSGVAVAVAQGSALPDISNEVAFKHALMSAKSIGYSTGPSGTELLSRLDQWGLRGTIEARLVQAPPGIPVANLVAQGKVALGFQQLAEMLSVPGISIVGLMPPELAIETIFSGAVSSTINELDRQTTCQKILAFMSSPSANKILGNYGMQTP